MKATFKYQHAGRRSLIGQPILTHLEFMFAGAAPAARGESINRKAELFAIPLDGRSFPPQLRGEKGQPGECMCCWHAQNEGPRAVPEVACMQQYKLYDDGRFYDIKQDPLLSGPLEEGALDCEVSAVHGRLRAATDERFRDMRPRASAEKGRLYNRSEEGYDN